jgi:enoyl-CoA hydratase/carnithine racemase
MSGSPDSDRREFTTLYADTDGPIGHLVLNRKSCLNAINDTLMAEMLDAIAWIDQHDELRAVIFKGVGRAFSAGADLKDLPFRKAQPESGNSWLRRRTLGQAGARLCEAIEGMRAVTIAQVHGAAVGGGVLLMICCDLRLVAPDTVMFIPEVELGMNYSWGAIPRMVREIGPALTKELVITCRRFTADEALRWRWINRVVPLDRLEREAEELAAEIARMPSVPAAVTKDHVNAIARVMGAGLTSYNDGDIALWMGPEQESKAAARIYAEAKVGKNRRK